LNPTCEFDQSVVLCNIASKHRASSCQQGLLYVVHQMIFSHYYTR